MTGWAPSCIESDMRNQPKPPKQATRATKSIRLTPEEVDELGRLLGALGRLPRKGYGRASTRFPC